MYLTVRSKLRTEFVKRLCFVWCVSRADCASVVLITLVCEQLCYHWLSAEFTMLSVQLNELKVTTRQKLQQEFRLFAEYTEKLGTWMGCAKGPVVAIGASIYI